MQVHETVQRMPPAADPRVASAERGRAEAEQARDDAATEHVARVGASSSPSNGAGGSAAARPSVVAGSTNLASTNAAESAVSVEPVIGTTAAPEATGSSSTANSVMQQQWGFDNIPGSSQQSDGTSQEQAGSSSTTDNRNLQPSVEEDYDDLD